VPLEREAEEDEGLDGPEMGDHANRDVRDARKVIAAKLSVSGYACRKDA